MEEDDQKLLPATTDKEPSWDDVNAKAKDLLRRKVRRLKKAFVNVVLFPFRVVKFIWDVIW